MNMFTKFQVDIINLRRPAVPRTGRRIRLSSTVANGQLVMRLPYINGGVTIARAHVHASLLYLGNG